MIDSVNSTGNAEEKTFPLSFNQQQLWLLDQLEEGVSTAYNLTFVRRLIGSLDYEILERSLNEIMRRHDVLRTRFTSVAGEPVQVVSESTQFDLKQVDIESLPPGDKAAECDRIVRFENNQPFDLTRGPLVRGILIRLKQGEYSLVLVTHHIIWDGWSTAVFDKELGTIYTAFHSQSASPLPALTAQYSTYSLWQREWIKGESYQQNLEFWKEYLADPLPEIELPLQHPRPKKESYAGNIVESVLDEALTQRLRGLGRDNMASLYAVLLSGFVALLYRYTEQEDIVLGTVIANRRRTELESLIGFFANTTVLRARPRGDLNFLELLAQVRTNVFDILEHGDMPFERLVTELQPERDRGRFPIVQLMFVLQNAPRTSAGLPGITVEPIHTANDEAKFDLSVSVTESGRQLDVKLDYSTELFTEATMRRMAGHFKTLLEGAVADPDAPIQSLPILTESELKMMLVDWNDTARDWPRDSCIHELFEQQVKEEPDAIALEFQGDTLTYAELNARANVLARRLREIGIAPEHKVAISTLRSMEMVIGLLAVLKAGGAYVPIDPDYPDSRKVYMMENSGSEAVLLQERAAEGFPDGPWNRIFLKSGSKIAAASQAVSELETGEGLIAIGKEESAVVKPDSSSLAYIIYTSGSTGDPKGVCIEHRHVVQLLIENDQVTFTRDDSIMQIAPLTFDGSVLQIWGALLNGAKLAIAPPEMPTISELGTFIRQSGITLVNMTAGLFHVLVDEQLNDLQNVRQMIIGGEALSPPHIQKVVDGLPNAVMTNAYGPTETTVTATCHHMLHGYHIGSTVPIGKPNSNMTAYVLDANMNPVPIGVMGELVLGGDGVGRGYLNAPELTADRFVSDPFSSDEGARMYRSGDRCRWLENGILEFVGRMDDQLKIRGFRVEPGEIEAALEQHEMVNESIIVGRKEAQGTTSLIAYVVMASGMEAYDEELRRYLEKLLPSYMTPSVFVFLDTFPLRPNGKVDRNALPEPSFASKISNEESDTQLTPTEETVAEFWKELFDVEHVRDTDHFFRIGGNSLQAMRLLARIREIFGLHVSLRTVFDEPRLKDFAAVIDAKLLGSDRD